MSTVEQANWEHRCISFMKQLADTCKDCLRTYNCPNCAIATAKALVQQKDQIGIRHHHLIDKPNDPNSIKARCKEIIGILKKAEKPLRSRDIHLRTTTSRNIKWWTLKRLVNKGEIRKCRIKNIYGRYETAFYMKGKEQ